MANKNAPELSPEKLAAATILREQVIPVFAQHGVARLALGSAKMSAKELPEGIRLMQRAPLGKAVKRRGQNSIVLASWPDDVVEALRFPGICFVYEGEADLRVGDAVLSCSAGYGLLLPAGVPRSAGHEPHWLRPEPEKAHSDILWVNFNSSGATCHHCHTRGTKHLSDYGWYSVVANRRLFALTEHLVEELEQKSAQFEQIGGAYLNAILHILLRHFSVDASPAEADRVPAGHAEAGGSPHPELVVARAQSYIDNHLAFHITMQDIAHAAYVSRARLAQIFKQQLGQTVWDYVTGRRIAEAKTLLADTDLYIYRIAYLTGFASPTTFSGRFTEVTGLSPGEFRLQAQTENAQKNTI